MTAAQLRDPAYRARQVQWRAERDRLLALPQTTAAEYQTKWTAINDLLRRMADTSPSPTP